LRGASLYIDKNIPIAELVKKKKGKRNLLDTGEK
jgi:hypothetical protein